MTMPADRSAVTFLTLAEVLTRRRCSRSRLYRDIARGAFPKPVQDGRRVLFIEHEVEGYVLDMIKRRQHDTAINAGGAEHV